MKIKPKSTPSQKNLIDGLMDSSVIELYKDALVEAALDWFVQADKTRNPTTSLRRALASSLDSLVAVTRTDMLTTGLIYPSKKPRRRKRVT